MDLTGWQQIAVIAFIVFCGVLGVALAVYVLVQLISWIVALLHM
jgi:hypothetical protein